MKAFPYWITDQLAIVPRPRGGDWLDEEMLALRESGIDAVVSLLTEPEASELGLGDEKESAHRAQLDFYSFPIPDRETPSADAFKIFLAKLRQELQNGKKIGFHCRACIGRATVTAASLLIQTGTPPETAWNLIEKARGCAVPDTTEQKSWVNRTMHAVSS